MPARTGHLSRMLTARRFTGFLESNRTRMTSLEDRYGPPGVTCWYVSTGHVRLVIRG